MTRRLQPCITCRPVGPDNRNPFAIPRGFTRHADRVCSQCRSWYPVGPSSAPRMVLLPRVGDANAPTLAELLAGTDLTPFLDWHGTDCPCVRCAADRIPGRYA